MNWHRHHARDSSRGLRTGGLTLPSCMLRGAAIFTEQGQNDNQYGSGGREDEGLFPTSLSCQPPTPVNRLDLPYAALTGLFTDKNRDLQRNETATRERKEVAGRPHATGLFDSFDTQHPPSDFFLASCLVSSLCLCPMSFPV